MGTTVSTELTDSTTTLEGGEDASVIKLVNQIFLEACLSRATDIHWEPYAGRYRIRYRIDGVLYDAKVPERLKELQPAIISRIKIMANMSISEKRLPQDGRIECPYCSRVYVLREGAKPHEHAH